LVAHGKAHWILDSLIAQGKARPMIVVMLDGHPLGMFSRETPPEKRGDAMNAFQRELFEDALPLVESLYRVEKDPAQRGIAGLSMGGAQALTIGLGNLGRFGWIGAFSAGPPSAEVMQKFLADPAAANAKSVCSGSPSARTTFCASGMTNSSRRSAARAFNTSGNSPTAITPGPSGVVTS
jgi:enterochelin esterase family protein